MKDCWIVAAYFDRIAQISNDRREKFRIKMNLITPTSSTLASLLRNIEYNITIFNILHYRQSDIEEEDRRENFSQVKFNISLIFKRLGHISVTLNRRLQEAGWQSQTSSRRSLHPERRRSVWVVVRVEEG